MVEEGKSKLYYLKPIINRYPSIKKPVGHVHFRKKMLWTLGILIFYFVLTNVMIYGLGSQMDMFSEFRAIMAGASGSLMHLGIGPIVTASIILQLFVGAKIIKLDMQNQEDKAIYQGTQKILVVVMIFVEAVPQVYGYLNPSSGFVGAVGTGWAKFFIIMQLAVGSYIVFLMDETVSKWGIGSGISMFICAGVAQAIFTGSLNWMPTTAGEALSISNPPSGVLPKTIYFINHMSVAEFSQGGFEKLFLAPPNAILYLIGTVVIFLVVAYLESTSIEIPLAHGRVRGARGRYPIRLIYASNIPVILMSALLANINMFSLLLWSHPTISRIPLLGHKWWIGAYLPQETKPYCGGAWYVSRVDGVHSWLLPILNWDSYQGYVNSANLPTPHAYWQVWVHVIVYLGIMIFGSILFAKFWIETTNMGPEDVAKQIQSSGMQIPGFRRDPRVLKKVLKRYIPMVTVISGAFVGGLAAIADMIGTVGNTSGTGVLLAVGIIIRLYEEIGKEQMMEMHPVLRGFFGNE